MTLIARPDAAKAPEAPLIARMMESTSANPRAPPEEEITFCRASRTTADVWGSAPFFSRKSLASEISPCWPTRPRTVTPSRRARNRDIIAKYVSVPAASVISCARKLANERLRTARKAGRPALSSPDASCTSSRLEAAATPAAVAVAAGSDAGEQDEDRGDDADDGGQAEHQAQPVDESREQDRDEDADHLTSPSGWTALAPGFGPCQGISPGRSALIPRLGEQGMALRDRRGHVDDRAVAASGVVAQQVERLALGDVVALHEDALRPFDERPALERGLEPLDLLHQPELLLVAPHRDLDRCLDRFRPPLARVGRDAALRRLGHELRVLLLDDRDHGAPRELADLVDEVEGMAVVLVDDDDRRVRVVARDHVRGLLHADRHLRDLVPQLAEQPGRDAQRPLVLVGKQHLQGAHIALVMRHGHRIGPPSGQPTCRHLVGRM